MTREKSKARHVRFNYLYRDASNFKRFGSVVFRNPNCTPTEELNRLVRDLLERRSPFPDVLQFRAESVGLPTLFFDADGPRTVDDLEYHEFECIESLAAGPEIRDRRTIEQFLNGLRNS